MDDDFFAILMVTMIVLVIATIVGGFIIYEKLETPYDKCLDACHTTFLDDETDDCLERCDKTHILKIVDDTCDYLVPTKYLDPYHEK